jgi:succinoglycan biosynthesis protein ExoA
MRPVERISLIIPMLNEAGHIEPLVGDIAAQDFSGGLEVFVADGGSTDGSVELLRSAAERAGLSVTILPNPDRWVSAGLNACIRASSGDLLVRLDCHTRYPSGYLRLVAQAAEETDAWNIGGLVIPVGRTQMERAVVCAMDSPFGGVHWTRHGRNSGRVEVDILHCGAYRPEGFERVGLFDESLVRDQDDDMAVRLRRAGGEIVLDTAIESHYIPRGSLGAAFRQYYEYGVWKVPVMLKHRRVVSARSLAPIAFLASTALLAVSAIWLPAARWLLGAELGVYVFSALGFAATSIRRHEESLRLLPRVIAVFPTIHLSYGLGMLRGWARAALRPSAAVSRQPMGALPGSISGHDGERSR